MNDEQLIVIATSGNNGAMDTLFSRHHSQLRRLLISRGCRIDNVDDILQECYIKAVTAIKEQRYRAEGKFANWLVRIACNTMASSFRKHHDNLFLTDIDNSVRTDDDSNRAHDANSFDEEYEGCERKIEFEENLEKLYFYIDMLPAALRDTVKMRLRGIKCEDIAKAQNSPLNTILGRINNAKKKLREAFGIYSY